MPNIVDESMPNNLQSLARNVVLEGRRIAEHKGTFMHVVYRKLLVQLPLNRWPYPGSLMPEHAEDQYGRHVWQRCKQRW